MKLTVPVLDELSTFIMGSTIKDGKYLEIVDRDQKDNNIITPYLTGPNLVQLFNSFGANDVYSGGLPNYSSRKEYIKTKLSEINGTNCMESLIKSLMGKRRYTRQGLNPNDALQCLNEIIEGDGYKLESVGGTYQFSKNQMIIGEMTEAKPTFEKIQNEIITEINKAKFFVWVSVAWFTDTALFDLLIEKRKQGLNIQIIICDDDTNKNAGLNFEKYFETHRIPGYGCYGNIVHTKFCVIDNKTVIHGSYNWTNRAKYNQEEILTVKDRAIAEKYASQFIELKKSNTRS